MASTSTSSVQKSFRYDVFLSFRGEDTRKGFVDHLYHALDKRGIKTYKDDKEIVKGERINEQLIRSIDDSRFYIIVFSKNYASSSWCLDELVKIMECQKMAEHTAYPVFYDVEPTEVRHQSGAVREAFAKVSGKGKRKRTEEDADEYEDDVGRWRNALTEAAGLAGMELKTTFNGHEAKFIQQIVQEISLRLHFVNSSIDAKLVGMETRVKNVVSSLETGSDDVRMIGIKGIGGGGKTTLARAVFDLMSVWFEGTSFVENVREVSKGPGLEKLQKQVLKDVLNDKSVDVTSVSDGKYKMKRRMCSVKALVVLDDVDDIDQLEALAGELNWFKSESRIIITTRDEQILVAHGVNFIHDVNLLSHEEAICLFSRYAFKTESPNQGYEDLSKNVVQYAAGLPLTLKVLGSHLCGRTESEWVDSIERLKTIPLEKTLTRLEISYDGLENDQKEIFLDVACLLKWMKRKEAIRVLESQGYHAEIGLRVLEQKSLITVSDGWLQMHDHLEEMGKNIVRRSHPEEPNKHSRLWITKEIDDILANDSGTNGTASLISYYSRSPLDIIMTGLRKIKELRVLFVDSDYDLVDIPDPVDQHLPNTLQSLYWYSYPFVCLPKTFQANNLVHLEMHEGNLAQLWEGGEKKVLNKLKFLILNHLDIRSFDMGMTPNLQVFHLEKCMEFVELSMPVACPKLKKLNIRESKVSSLKIGSAPCLEKLRINECFDLVELQMPAECPKLKLLELWRSKVSSLNIGSAPCLETLDLENSKDLVELHIPVKFLKLEHLDLCGSKVSSLNIGSAPCLKTLNLENCNDLVELHIPVDFPKLKVINLCGSKVRSLNIGSAPCLEMLALENCDDLVELQMPVEFPKLELLQLCGSKVSSLNIGPAPCLNNLNLANCNDLVELHIPVECLKLEHLELCSSKVSSLNIGWASRLVTLDLENCNKLAELHMPVECPNLKHLVLCSSKVSSLNIRSAPCLETLNLANCNDLVELHIPVEWPKLKLLDLRGSKVSSLNIGSAPCLKTLNLANCNDLVELHIPVEYPKLELLDLCGSKVSSLNIGSAPCLVTLYLENCNNLVELHMPVEFPKLELLELCGSKVSSLNIGSAPCLETLDLENCNDLVELHMPVEFPKLQSLVFCSSKVSSLNIVSAPCLETLALGNCNDLVELHIPVECPKLEFLDLRGSKVSSLNIGAAPCLEWLNLENCNNLVELNILVELPKLKILNLSCSKVRNVNLELTPHLERLDLKNCYFLQEIHNHVGYLEKIVYLDLSGCSRFEYFQVDKGDKLIGHDSVATMLNLTAESLDTCPLHPDSNLPKFQFKCLYDEALPSSSGNLEKLLSFGLCACTNLESFSASICGLQGLKKLKLEGSIPEVPKDLYLLESLERLTLSMKEITHLPDSICMLKHLKYLKLKYCLLLEKLPNSICNMKSLECLDLRNCSLVEKLPEEFGRLESLKYINIEGAGIRHLSQSIFELKGLYIFGSASQLESYGFTDLKEISTDPALFYIRL